MNRPAIIDDMRANVRAHVSPGNMKMGAMPSVSLSPVVTCIPGAPCARSCYAVKVCRYSQSAKLAYARNWALAESDPDAYFSDVLAFIRKRSPAFFRFHVSGDIPSQGYLDRVKLLAEACPDVKFLVFTKRYAFDYKGCPDNLCVVFSCWPGLNLPRRHKGPRAYMQDGSETRIPDDAIQCPGSCETCGMCWSLRKTGRDVWFPKH
jgi:hypothetical protein